MNNPIPPQRASYSDEGSRLFTLPWYLFFSEIQEILLRLIVQIAGFFFVTILDFAPDDASRDLLRDGASHPLSDFYSTLAGAQQKYPFATTLTMEVAAASLQLGINTLNDAGGGRLYIPEGTYLIHDVTLRQTVWIWGSGFGSAFFQMPDGKNTYMLKSADFDTLYATIATHTDPTPPSPGTPPNLSMGIWAFGLDGISFDGNKDNNASGAGILIYGYNFVMKHLRIFDFAGIGLTTAWSNAADFPDWTDAMEGHFYDIKSHDNGDYGWRFNGPHDSRTVMCEVYENATTGFYLGRNGASYLDGLHSYGPTQLIAFRNDELCHMTDCIFETAQGAQIVANNAILGNCKIFSVSTITTSVGMQLGSVIGGAKTITNITGGSGIDLTVTFSTAHGYFTNDQIAINSVVGITGANYSPWVVTKINSTQVSLNFSSTVTGSYSSGGFGFLVGIPNGMQLILNISNCYLGLFNTTNAYGSGNTIQARGFFTPDFTNPLVFVGGTNTALYNAALATLDGWDYNIWINSDSTKPLGNLHQQNTTGYYARRIDIKGPESTEIGVHLRGSTAASITNPYFAFTRNANNTSGQIYTDDGATLINFYEADYAALQNILYQNTLIKNLMRLFFESTSASIHANGPDPEGAVVAEPGSLYLRSTGALYVKASGSGDTGWEKILTFGAATEGDLLVGDSGGNFGTLGIGTAGNVLQVVAGTAAWGAADLTDSNTVDVSGLTTGEAVVSDGSALTTLPGMTGSVTLVTGVGGATNNFNLTGGGSAAAFVSITTTTVTMNFTNGLWTS